jgi:dihydroorotase
VRGGGRDTASGGRFDLLLKDGEFIDPASGRRGQWDVAFADGKVAAIRSAIDPGSAACVVSAAGAMVVPGLIDMHAHPVAGIGEGVDPDAIGLQRGVTTVADGGTCGTGTFGAFRSSMAASRTRLLAWLNLSSIGQADTRVGELIFLAAVNVDEMVALAAKHPDTIVGFKARLSTYVTGGGSALRPLKLLLEAGEAAKLPVMIHVGDTAEPLGRILEMLRPGDVVSHYLTSRKHNLLGIQATPGAPIIPEAFAARERGVLFDTARGRNHMAFPQMEAAVAQGLLPDTLSTDLALHTAADPNFTLLAVATQFMAFGLSVDDCLVRMTVNPARILRRPDLGMLAVGGGAEATLVRIEHGTFRLSDADGRIRTTDRRLVAAGVVRAGEYVGLTPPPVG